MKRALRLAKKTVKVAIIATVHPRRAKHILKAAMLKRKINAERRNQYIKWYKRRELSPTEIENQQKASKKFKNRPLISILLPTYNTPEKFLRDCIESILAQTYDNWELCIADDASSKQVTKEVIHTYVKKYKNIKAVLADKNGHIASASNLAMTLAKGEFISLMDHDDLLLPNALFETVKVINEQPDADLIYSDEDKIEDDKWHVEPFFKPDWSPDFLLSCNVITHFATIRTGLMKKVGGFRVGSEGAQDWDLFLRLTELTDKIYHIPKIVYVWRKSPMSTAATYENKNYAYINQKKVLRDAVARRGQPAVIEAHRFMGFWRVRYEIKGLPKVSIIIPTKNNYEYIKRCLESVFEATNYPNFEVIIVDTGTTDDKTGELYEKLQRAIDNIKIVKWQKKGDFNFSAACNFGAAGATGEYLLFLNDDIKVIDSHWLRDMLEHAQRPETGAVGCKLLFPNRTIQHAGVVLSWRDIAFHPFYGLNERLDIFSNIFINNIRNVSAVTGACLMVDKNKFEEVGGFDEKLKVTYNDVDFCLKLLEKGYRNVYTPFARLIHYESASIARITTDERDKKELQAASDEMRKRWAQILKNDPYYNPNFIQHGPGYWLY